MRTTITELDGCFSFDFVAETLEEAATLVRFGMNSLKEPRYKAAAMPKNGYANASIVFGKNKRADSIIPRRK